MKPSRDFIQILWAVALVLSFGAGLAWIAWSTVTWLHGLVGPLPILSGLTVILLMWCFVAELRVAVKNGRIAGLEGTRDRLETKALELQRTLAEERAEASKRAWNA